MLRLAVIAHPGSRAERIEVSGDDVHVWVRARPVDGQANAAIERAIATYLRLRPRQVRLVAGTNSRRKIVDVDLPSLNALHERLLAHGVRPD